MPTANWLGFKGFAATSMGYTIPPPLDIRCNQRAAVTYKILDVGHQK